MIGVGGRIPVDFQRLVECAPQVAQLDALGEAVANEDVILAPACSVSPFPHAHLTVETINGEKMDTYMRWLAIAYGVTLTTHPVVAVPCGRDALGLPFGIQVVGRMGQDARLIDIAHSLERAMAADTELARPLPDLDRLTR